MDIVKDEITIRELTKGYENNDEEGVFALSGNLDIRPPYQREFVYKEKQRDAVIETILNGFPLNIMYWNTKDDGTYEILDGQQRTISICEYVANNFSFNKMIFNRQPDDIQNRILDYKLDIYKCKGDASERRAWFEVINIAGEKLTNQEILNAVYAGAWVSDAKKYFSKTNCPAYEIGNKLMEGRSIRQEYLETVIKWHSPDGDIAEYMNQNCKKPDAKELRLYYERVISWVKAIFIGCDNDYRPQMKGVQWGELFNEHGTKQIDSKKIQSRVDELFKDDDITKLGGIYPYVLDGKEKHLSIRAFKDNDKQRVYEQQGRKCANKKCPDKGKTFELKEMEADHIKPWSEGGKTELANCQMLCKACNRRKGAS